MFNKKLQVYFLLACILGVGILTFLIFRPFLYTLVFAAVFMVLFQPLQQKILNLVKGRQGVASLLTLLVIIVFIFAPFVFLGFQITQEAKQLYLALTEKGAQDAFLDVVRNILNYLQGIIPFSSEFSLDTDAYLQKGFNWLAQNFGYIFSGIAGFLIDFLIFLAALYFLLRDGNKLRRLLVKVSPLEDKDDELVLDKLEAAINSVIKGRLLVAIIQGTLIAVGFLIFGIPNPVLWGSVAVLTALIPGAGTSIVTIPAIIFLFLDHHPILALGFAFWGVVIVGLIDNVIGPKFMSRGIQIHPFLIFLSVLGGIIFFGPVGFLLGPLIISTLFAFLDIYFSLLKKANT
ncbi:MAG: putative inner membrane protein [Parcubacteria group bacterium ADurb.Bin316]|nr:MAG: putative inner membrane protein [Parcubacteria group bacterium ADurb.Bin316]HOZ56451.1 AI-2E family transporter [bacterium]